MSKEVQPNFSPEDLTKIKKFARNKQVNEILFGINVKFHVENLEHSKYLLIIFYCHIIVIITLTCWVLKDKFVQIYTRNLYK